jgi:hypothetical protein
MDSAITFDVRDEFQRKPIAEKVMNLLLSDVEVSPMVIDGQWGTGKTEFCHKLINMLGVEDGTVKCAYVDAFKADHANDPLGTLIAAVANLIEEKQKQSAFIKKAVPAVRYGLKTLGKASVSWVLKQNTDDIVDGLEDAIKKSAEEGINSAVERLIQEHQESEENLAALRDALEEVATDNPIMVFVDEMDRCRPDFAITLLENIKHVFDVKNVQFVLVANIGQLKSSINHCYGLGVDAQRYLDKFVKFSFKLSSLFTTDQNNFSPSAAVYARNLIGENEALSSSDLRHEAFLALIDTLLSNNTRSLREAETFVRYVVIYNILCGNKGFPERLTYGYGLFRLLAIYYFCFHPELSEQINNQYIDGPELAKVLGINAYTPFDGCQNREQNFILAISIFLESTTPVAGLDRTDSEDITAWRRETSSYLQLRTSKPLNIVSETIRTLQMAR